MFEFMRKRVDTRIQTGRGTIFILIGKIAMILVALAQAVIIPRTLGPKGMGFYSYWISIYFILASVFQLGGPSIIARYVPGLRIRQKEAIKPLINTVLLMRIPVIVLVGLAGSFFFREEFANYLVIFVGAVFFSLAMVFSSVFYAYRRMEVYASMPIIRITLKVGLILLLFPLWGNQGSLWALLGSAIVICVCFGLALLPLLPTGSGKRTGATKEYVVFGLWVYLAALAGIMSSRLVVVLARQYIDDLAIIGFLGLAQQALFVLTPVVFSIGDGVLPSLIESYTLASEKISLSLELAWKYTNLLVFPLMTGIYVLARPGVALLVGEDFIPAVSIINLFIPAMILISWSYIHRQIIFTYKKQKFILISALIRLTVFLSSAPYLLKIMGISGVPIAVFLGSLASYICNFIVSRRIRKIPRYIQHIIRPIIASIGGGLIISFIPVSSFVSLVGVATAGLSLYFFLMWLIKGISSQDIRRIGYALMQ